MKSKNYPFLHPDDEGSMFLRSLGTCIPNYTASQAQTSNEISFKRKKD
jgi:hypothetical protein